MTEPVPAPPLADQEGRILSPKLRLYLYFAAGIVIALWLSLEILGTAGFAAFVTGMLAAQLAFRFRGSINVAFFAGLIAYALTIGIWTAAIGPPGPTNTHATQTAAADPSDS